MKKIDKNKIKTWFVTGASSGVGHELCICLIKRGYNVVAVSRHITDIKHENCISLSCDVTDINEINSAINIGMNKFGKIDVLINSAGISSYETAEEESYEEMRNVMETNFWGSYNTCRLFLPIFRNNKFGTIVNITSVHGLVPRRFGAAYVSSKYALEGLTGVLRFETERFCRVMALEISYFKTNIGKGKPRNTTKFDEYKNMPYYPFEPKNKDNNDLSKAMNFLIDTIEKEKIPRHLMLGHSIIERVLAEINSIKKDCLNSKKMAYDCFINISYIEKIINKQNTIFNKLKLLFFLLNS